MEHLNHKTFSLGSQIRVEESWKECKPEVRDDYKKTVSPGHSRGGGNGGRDEYDQDTLYELLKELI